MKKILVLVGVSVLAASSMAVTIDFEDRAEGDLVNTQYAGMGITFAAGPLELGTDMHVTSTDVGGGYDATLHNVLHTFGGWLNEATAPDMTFSFSTGISSLSMVFTGYGNSVCGFDVRDAGNNVIATVNAVSGGGSTQTLSWTGPGTAMSAHVLPGTFGDWVGVDNVTFTAVPEPASMIALGLGVAALARKRRK